MPALQGLLHRPTGYRTPVWETAGVPSYHAGPFVRSGYKWTAHTTALHPDGEYKHRPPPRGIDEGQGLMLAPPPPPPPPTRPNNPPNQTAGGRGPEGEGRDSVSVPQVGGSAGWTSCHAHCRAHCVRQPAPKVNSQSPVAGRACGIPSLPTSPCYPQLTQPSLELCRCQSRPIPRSCEPSGGVPAVW